MKVKTSDLSKILSQYSSKWLALKPDSMQVVGVGKNPKDAMEKAQKKGVGHPVLTRAPKDYGAYIL